MQKPIVQIRPILVATLLAPVVLVWCPAQQSARAAQRQPAALATGSGSCPTHYHCKVFQQDVCKSIGRKKAQLRHVGKSTCSDYRTRLRFRYAYNFKDVFLVRHSLRCSVPQSEVPVHIACSVYYGRGATCCFMEVQMQIQARNGPHTSAFESYPVTAVVFPSGIVRSYVTNV